MNMKKHLAPILIVLAAILCFAGIIAYGFYDFGYDLDAIKPGEKICESMSPGGKYTLTGYLNNGGATTDYAVLCQLDDGKHKKNIYWQYHFTGCDISWVDEDTVIINGVRLEDVETDTYDYRR